MELTVLGELLIDFTQAGESENGMRLFEQNPGGAVANVATAAARLGHKTAFIGKVGNDMHGRFLARVLEEVGIDCRGLVFSDEAFTTLAFVALDEKGERSFSFARKPGADTCLRPEELNRELLQSSRIALKLRCQIQRHRFNGFYALAFFVIGSQGKVGSGKFVISAVAVDMLQAFIAAF